MHHKIVISSISFVILAISLAAASAFAAPVAIVTDLQGGAKLELNGESSVVNILDNLEAEASVEVSENNSITLVYYESGVEYTYAGPARFIVSPAQPKLLGGNDGLAKELKALEETGLKPADNVVQAATVFRSAGNSKHEIKLLNPVNTKVLETAPQFAWLGLEGSPDYRFILKSSRGLTVFEDTLKENTLQLPENSLRYGRKYTWELSASIEGKKYRGFGAFQVGTQSAVEYLKTNMPAKDASFSEKAVYALLLKQQGFGQAAKEQWATLRKERPEQVTNNDLLN